MRSFTKLIRIKKIEKKLSCEQRSLSRIYENKKKRGEKPATYSINIAKQVKKVQVVHQTVTNVRRDFIAKVRSEIVKTKPYHITIEDLNVSGMMIDRHLSKAIEGENFYEFRARLKNKCSCCGAIKKNFKFSDRT